MDSHGNPEMELSVLPPLSSDTVSNLPSKSPSKFSILKDIAERFEEREKSEITIPKIIMQTWKTNEVPEHWKPSPESIKEYMSDWTHILMTDEDNRRLVADNFPDFLPYYDAFPYPIQRADAVRYVFAYLYGGVYMDLDLKLNQSLADYFTADSELYIVTSGNIGSYITNSFFASQPGCKVFLDMIEHMKKPAPAWAIGKHFTVMTTTGPIGFNSVIKKSNISYVTLPAKLFMPCSVCNMDTCSTSSSAVTPLKGGSWNGPDSLFLNEMLCNWDSVVVVILLFFLFYLVIQRK